MKDGRESPRCVSDVCPFCGKPFVRTGDLFFGCVHLVGVKAVGGDGGHLSEVYFARGRLFKKTATVVAVSDFVKGVTAAVGSECDSDCDACIHRVEPPPDDGGGDVHGCGLLSAIVAAVTAEVRRRRRPPDSGLYT